MWEVLLGVLPPPCAGRSTAQCSVFRLGLLTARCADSNLHEHRARCSFRRRNVESRRSHKCTTLHMGRYMESRRLFGDHAEDPISAEHIRAFRAACSSAATAPQAAKTPTPAQISGGPAWTLHTEARAAGREKHWPTIHS